MILGKRCNWDDNAVRPAGYIRPQPPFHAEVTPARREAPTPAGGAGVAESSVAESRTTRVSKLRALSGHTGLSRGILSKVGTPCETRRGEVLRLYPPSTGLTAANSPRVGSLLSPQSPQSIWKRRAGICTGPPSLVPTSSSNAQRNCRYRVRIRSGTGGTDEGMISYARSSS